MCLNPYFTIKNKNGEIIDLKRFWNERDKIFGWNMKGEKGLEQAKSLNIIQIPCGKCKECLKSKYMEWSKRIKKELKMHKTNYVINLTYDNNNVKELNKRDLQLFFKKLRKKYTTRYFYIGELGDEKKRPHYHLLMFGMEKPKDLKEIEQTKRGNKQYQSQEITNIWGKGRTTINNAETTEISYLFKYMFKNANKKEFIMQMSKQPPIGINPETIKNDIQKLDRTKGLKRYYKNHIGDIPTLKAEEEQHNINIKDTEKLTKLKFIHYLKQKINKNT